MNNQNKPQDNVPKMEAKQKCIKCNGRTALISGYWYYSPDQEPYENDVIEPTERNESEAYMNGFICDDCNTIQDVFVDEENYKSRIAELEKQNAVYREALEGADELLSRLEDYTHGRDGVDITTTRNNIQQALKPKDNV